MTKIRSCIFGSLSGAKYIISLIGVILTLCSLVALIISNMNVGNIIIFISSIIVALWFRVPKKPLIKYIKLIILLCYTVALCIAVFIMVMGHIGSADYREDAVIVLGCAVNGKQPSNSLQERIKTAVKYSQKNPSAIIVVTGGQGPQEDLSEAQAMYNELVKAGVDCERILKEDKATSTNENFRYSKELLDERLGNSYTTAYITNSFHSYRAGRLAELNGIKSKPCNARTLVTSAAAAYAREVLAVIQLWIFKR
jgi:uncharacterized SAM-binding protein YcdF (DUF218 family)